MKFANAHILSSSQFAKADLERIFDLAETFLPFATKKKHGDFLKGKVLATLFFEASTRTRFSFETAMFRLGGSVLTHADMMRTSSVVKQETLFDTGRTVSAFADVIVMRHPHAGSVAELAKGSYVPVINGGDGPSDHPTQGLLDLFTVRKHFGKLDGLTIGMVGDLKHSRVVHSQATMLMHYKNLTFFLVSPKELSMPREIVQKMKSKGFAVHEAEVLEDVIGKFDVLSDTRIQEERFSSHKEYMKFKGVYRITPAFMKKAKKDMIVIAPLPRVDELAPEVDTDPRAKYWEQITNGVAVRMAFFALVLGKV